MSEFAKPTGRITMADVAREVGVSMMTVSRVINDKGDVSDVTRERVLEAVERLGYRPSGIARSLATRHTGTLGLVVPDVANPFFAEVARGVEHIAYAEGYNVFLCNTDEDPERELDVLGSLEEKRVDGIVLCSSRLTNADLQLIVSSHPAVALVNRRVDGCCPSGTGTHGVRAVLVDDVRGGELATRHLLSRKHSTIGFLSGPKDSRSGQGRLDGYRRAMQQAGLPIRSLWIRSCAPVAEAGREAARELLSRQPELTALLCYNDLVAVGALRACADLGLRVPDDLAVVGFDDILLAALVTPPLTTCRIPRKELGVQAVKQLLAQIRSADVTDDEPADTQEIILQPELVIRASAP